ncbi:MAG: hypothetical protein H6738_01095 [Alphaproteobacteria bacterium]|nr:hypothetical protein [Alphaproteobacteria bacterium]MCB9695363.1 hypothetical protein [Alphaproteobacteria bacterium]
MPGLVVIALLDLLGLTVVSAVFARAWSDVDGIPYEVRSPLLAVTLAVQLALPVGVAATAVALVRRVASSTPSSLAGAAAWVLIALATPCLGWDLQPSPTELRMHGPLIQTWMAMGATTLLGLLPAPATPLGRIGIPLRATVIWAVALGVFWTELTLLQLVEPPRINSVVAAVFVSVSVVWVGLTAAAGALPRPNEWKAQLAALVLAALLIPLSLPEAAQSALRGLRRSHLGWDLVESLMPLAILSLFTDLIVVIGGLWVYLLHRAEGRRRAEAERRRA